MQHKLRFQPWIVFALLALLVGVIITGEPQPATAQGGPIRIEYGQSATGQTIDINTPIVYVFNGRAGDQVVIEATSNSVDTLLLLADRNATTEYARNDDIDSQNLNSRIEFTLPATADYLIGVFGYTSGPYTLTLTLASVQPPQQPGQPSAGQTCEPSAQQGETPLYPNQPATGQIESGNAPAIVYVICGNAGDQIVIDLTSDTVDTYLVLADVQGNSLVEHDDIAPGQDTNAHIEFTLPATGEYLIGVLGYSGGPYTLIYTSSAAAPATPPATQPPAQPGSQNAIQYGQTVTGDAIDLDNAVVYRFTGAAGDSVIVEATSDAVDTVLVLADASGARLVDNDDISRDNLNSRIEFVLPANGDYLIGVFAYRPGPFTLTLNKAEGATPVQPTGNEQPTGQVTTGTIDNNTFFKEISVTGVPAGATLRIDVRATSGDLDTYIGLVYGQTVLAENDDREQNNTNSYLEYPNAEAGDYTVVVTRYGGRDGRTTGDFEATIAIVQGTVTVASPGVSTPNPTASGYPTLNNPIADWTILAYIGGDNNLEAPMLFDLNEFELGGGSNERVRIVALIDRSGDYDDSNGNWTGVRVYEIGPDRSGDHNIGVPTIDSIPLANLGQLDTGYGNNLADFLVWGVTNFPARHYALEINDHGAAWVGMVTDDTAQQILLLPELQQAFEAGLRAANVPKFDLLINDACLMSSIEYFAAVAPYFNYSLSSTEIQLVPGFDMSLLTQMLNENPEIPLEQLGKAMIDKYFDDVAGQSTEAYLTAVFTDLNQFQPVLEALNGFTAAVNINAASYASILGRSRTNAYAYSFFESEPPTSIDLGSFMKQIISNARDPQLTARAQTVLDTLDAQRIQSRGGAYVSQYVSYYNIYFPERAADFIPAYSNLTPISGWAEMLTAYYNNIGTGTKATSAVDFFGLPGLARSVTPQVTITNVYPTETSIVFPTSVSMEVVGRNISHGTFTVDQIQPDGTSVRFDSARIVTLVVQDSVASYINQWDSGVDDSVFTWEVTLPVVTDGTVSNNELVVTRQGIASLSGRYRFPNSTLWQDVTVLFDDAGNTENIIASDTSGLGIANITVIAGGEFQAYRSVVTADGRVVQEPGNSYTWPEGGIRWYDAPAPSGQYNLGFLVEAFGGATGFDSTTVTVNNDGLTGDLRGYVDLDWGFRFQHPADWFDVTYFPEQDWLQTTNDTESAYIFVYPVYNATSPDLTAIANDVLSRYEVAFDGQFTPTTIAGREALEFAFTYGEGFVARAFAVYQPDLELGLVFSVETNDGTTDTHYQNLVNSLVFFDNLAVNSQDTGVWASDFVSDETSYPVRRDWLEGFDVNGWWTYTPNADPNSATFAKAMKTAGADAKALLESTLAATVGANAGYQLLSTETYYGENHTWEVATFSYNANGTVINGRIHVTVNPDTGDAYILWFEAPQLESREIFANIFEPMLDGFKYTE